jgi:hypothetical protein
VRTFWREPAGVAKVVGVLGLCLLVAWLAQVLLHKDQHRSGTNFVDVAHFFTDVPAGSTICQKELIPKDTGGVRMLVTSYHQPTPTLRLAVKTLSGRTVSTGVLRAGWLEGMNDIALTTVRQTIQGRLCIRDVGPAHMTPAGENFDPANGATLDGQPLAGLMSIQYLRPGPERWISLAPVILGRIRHGKAGWFGTWVPALLIALMLACVAGATTLAVRR